MALKPRLIQPDADQNFSGRILAYNAAGSNIAKNSLVYVSGAHTSPSRYLEVALADADGAARARRPDGVSFALILDGQRGTVAEWAIVDGLDTSAYTAGDPVYLSDTAGGYAIGTPPESVPEVVVGEVLRSDASVGAILLAPKAYRDRATAPTLTTTVTIANAAVRTLNATPVTLLPAPGAGFAYLVDRVVAKLDYATAAFDDAAAGEDLAFKYTDGGGAQLTSPVDHDGFANASADVVRAVAPVAELTLLANAAVVAHILSGEWYSAAGGSDLVITLHYRIVAV